MLLQDNDNQHGLRKLFLLLFLTGAAVLLISPISGYPLDMGGKPVIIITAQGDQSYYWGEEIVFSGVNSASDSTYLLLTGPNLPESGVALSSPRQQVITGNAGSFTVVKTKQDKTWEYTFYSGNLPLDAGSYTAYAVNKPVSPDRFSNDTTYGTISIIVKRPFITAGIAPVPVIRGQPFTITGTAEGEPPSVQLWIVGDNTFSTAITHVNPGASFTYTADTSLSEKLRAGQNFLIVQHPMQDNQFDIVVAGDYVRSMLQKNNSILFRIAGPGSLQGSDAKDALVAAFSTSSAQDQTYTVDTYTIVPFMVTDAGNPATAAQQVTTTTIPHPTTQHAPLVYAPAGAVLLAFGMMILTRHKRSG